MSTESSKKEKQPYWKRFQKEHLSSGDSALFLVSFTAIFGILCHEPGGSIYFLCLFIAFAAFWLYMMFAGGRRKRRGTWLTAAILWGIALIYAALNWMLVVPMGNPESTGGLLSVIMGILYIPTSAVINPVFPLLYRCGYTATAFSASQNAVLLIEIVGIAVVLLGLSYFIGALYEKNHGRGEKNEKDRFSNRL